MSVAWPAGQRSDHPTDFLGRCSKRLENLGDIAMDSKIYDGAVELFSMILSLNPACYPGILIKRSKARAFMESWDAALRDADKVNVYFMPRSSVHHY